MGEVPEWREEGNESLGEVPESRGEGNESSQGEFPLAGGMDRVEISGAGSSGGSLMNLTRVFTFVGLTLVLLAFIPVLMGKFWEAIYLLGFVVVAGISVVIWNLRK